MTGKRVVFTGGTGKAGRHVLPHLKSKGYDLLNVDLKPFDHRGINTLIADLTHSGQAFNALTTHFGFDRFEAGRPPAAPDAVVHFAAIPRVLIEPDNETFRVNTVSTYNVIEAAANARRNLTKSGLTAEDFVEAIKRQSLRRFADVIALRLSEL